MLQWRWKILRAATKTWHSQINIYILKSYITQTSLVVQELSLHFHFRGCGFDSWSRNQDPTCLQAVQCAPPPKCWITHHHLRGWKVKTWVAQSCLTLCNPMDCSTPGTSVHGFLQARILEWVAIPFFRGSSQLRDRSQVTCIPGRFFTVWATYNSCLLLYLKCSPLPEPHGYTLLSSFEDFILPSPCLECSFRMPHTLTWRLFL